MNRHLLVLLASVLAWLILTPNVHAQSTCTPGQAHPDCPAEAPYESLNNCDRCCSQANSYACINNSTGQTFCSTSSDCSTGGGGGGGGGGSTCTPGQANPDCPAEAPYESLNNCDRCCSQANSYACINNSTGQTFCSTSSSCSVESEEEEEEGGGGSLNLAQMLALMFSALYARRRLRFGRSTI